MFGTRGFLFVVHIFCNRNTTVDTNNKIDDFGPNRRIVVIFLYTIMGKPDHNNR